MSTIDQRLRRAAIFSMLVQIKNVATLTPFLMLAQVVLARSLHSSRRSDRTRTDRTHCRVRGFTTNGHIGHPNTHTDARVHTRARAHARARTRTHARTRCAGRWRWCRRLRLSSPTASRTPPSATRTAPSASSARSPRARRRRRRGRRAPCPRVRDSDWVRARAPRGPLPRR